MVSGFDSGSYAGPATAPTEIVLNFEGLAPAQGGNFVAYLSIDAVLVPEPASTALLLTALVCLAAIFYRKIVREHRSVP
jgi:hypothetical protein